MSRRDNAELNALIVETILKYRETMSLKDAVLTVQRDIIECKDMSEQAIKSIFYRCGKRAGVKQYYNKWTDAEIARVRQIAYETDKHYNLSAHIAQVAEELDRPEASVRQKYYELFRGMKKGDSYNNVLLSAEYVCSVLRSYSVLEITRFYKQALLVQELRERAQLKHKDNVNKQQVAFSAINLLDDEQVLPFLKSITLKELAYVIFVTDVMLNLLKTDEDFRNSCVYGNTENVNNEYMWMCNMVRKTTAEERKRMRDITLIADSVLLK